MSLRRTRRGHAGAVSEAGEPDLGLRRRPVQERGRTRFDLILRTGRAQLAEVGIDGFTFDGLASAAAIPIGSIYQYFPNKHSLVCELSAQDTDAIVEALRRSAEQFPSDDWQADVDRLIDQLADLWRSDPGRRHVWLAMQSTAPTRSLAAEQTALIADQIVPPARAILIEQQHGIPRRVDAGVEPRRLQIHQRREAVRLRSGLDLTFPASPVHALTTGDKPLSAAGPLPELTGQLGWMPPPRLPHASTPLPPLAST